MFEREPELVISPDPLTAKGCSEIASTNKDVARANEAIASELAAQNRSRNRVDITPEEYEALKNRIKQLESDLYFSTSVLKQIDFPLDMLDKIIPGTLETLYCDYIPEFNKPRRRSFDIKFEVELKP